VVRNLNPSPLVHDIVVEIEVGLPVEAVMHRLRRRRAKIGMDIGETTQELGRVLQQTVRQKRIIHCQERHLSRLEGHDSDAPNAVITQRGKGRKVAKLQK
jgi:hypothetical protein